MSSEEVQNGAQAPKPEIRKSKIGGQALIEGIMMKGPFRSAMACRLPNGKIDLEVWDNKHGKNPPWYCKAPFIRGSVNMVSQLIEGYKCLMKSSDKQMQEDTELEAFIKWYRTKKIEALSADEQKSSYTSWLETQPASDKDTPDYDKRLEQMAGYNYEEPSKLDKWLSEKAGDKLVAVFSALSIIISLALCVFLFMFLPTTITKLFSIDNAILNNVVEGVIKIAIFVGYLWLTSLMKDIRITYGYHGAEHKTIACIEADDELTVANVRKYTRFHPRCGTSFMFIVFFISVLVFCIVRVPWTNVLMRMAFKLLLLPVIVGISYELIRLAGRHTNPFTRAISAPGLLIQRITTREPSDRQIEVAIAAVTPCLVENKEEDVW